MLDLPAKFLCLRVTNFWYQIIKASYITTGSARVSAWHAGRAEGDQILDRADPGMLTLFILQARSGDMYVIGGGFLLRREDRLPREAWNAQGVRNGVPDYEEFLKRIREQGGQEDEPISRALFNGVFIFSRREGLLIPGEFAQHFRRKRCFQLSENEPIGRYLMKVSLERRFPQLQQGRAENDWPGIYLMASQRHSFLRAAAFQARMFKLYNFSCAVTGSTSRLVLDVAHIKTFFNDSFHSENNGIVMRNDIHRLFSRGYMTAYYKSAEKVLLRCSPTLADHESAEYLKYDGCQLRLPQQRRFWPSKEYLQWHQEMRFENWLKFGDIKPVGLDTTPEVI